MPVVHTIYQHCSDFLVQSEGKSMISSLCQQLHGSVHVSRVKKSDVIIHVHESTASILE